MALPQFVYLVDYTNNWNSTVTTWTTVHNSGSTALHRAIEFSFNRGRQSELQAYSRGQLDVLLRNDNDLFTAESTASLGEFIGSRVRANIIEAGTTYTLITAIGDDDPIIPIAAGKGLNARHRSVDAIDTLSRIDISSTFSSGVDSGARIGSILTAAGWPSTSSFRDLATGGSTALKAVEYEEESALSAIEHTLKSEQGRFFVDALGRTAFHARRSLQVPGAPVLVFGNQPAAIDGPYFYGTALDDLTLSGTYSGSPGSILTVSISTANTTSFNWSISGTTYSATGVGLSTAGSTLALGIVAAFGASTGHASGDVWTAPLGEINFQLPEPFVGKRDTSNLYTKATATVVETTGEITSQSTAGIDAYLPRTLNNSLLMLSTGEAQDLADYQVLKYGMPQRRFEQVNVSGLSSTDWWAPILSRQIGDSVKVKYRTPGGTTIQQKSFVEGISGAGSPAPSSWVWSFYLSPQDANEYIILDDLVQGRIESTASSTGYALGY